MKKQKSRPVTMAVASTAEAFFRERLQPQITDWIRIGLEHYVGKVGSFSGFAPLEGYFSFDAPVSEGLAAIKATLDSEGGSKLRNGLAQTLDHLPVTIETAAVIKEVLYCAKRVDASEIFRYLPAKMKGMSQSEGAFFEVSSKEIGGRNLFEVAFQITADMPVEGSGWVLEELVATSLFHFSQAGLALDALCRKDPDNFPAHFDRLREDLDKMFLVYETPDDIKRQLAKRIIKSIGLNVFSEKHYLLRFEATHNRTNDNWFHGYLFTDTRPLLREIDGKIAWADSDPATWHALSPKPGPVPPPPPPPVKKPEPEEHNDPQTIFVIWRRRTGLRIAA
ncbi:hypothetical protein [Bradyrhizobium sp.]